MLHLTLLLLAAPQAAPLPSPLVADADGLLRPAPDRLAALAGRLDLTLEGLAIPGLEARRVELERLPSATADAELWIDGEPARTLGADSTDDFSLWRGELEGAPGSDVLLAFSRHGSRGWVRAEGELWHLLAEPDPVAGWSAARSRWVPDGQIRELRTALPECAQLEVPGNPMRVQAGPPTAFAAAADEVLYQARVAVETDFAFYQLFGNVPAAEVYAMSLFGAMSDTYREEIGTRVDVAYLGLYTNANDPWNTPDNGGGTIDALFEFRDAWIGGWPVEADLAHFVSGAPLGGGVAWVGVLGIADYAYAVSANLAGQTPFPVAQGPLLWDYFVTAHETGHNFGTGHTHNYCPPLDQCAPSDVWGQCQDATECVEGTIMSYCHLCEGGVGNIRPEFHPTVRQVLREEVLESALRPFEGIEFTNLGGALAGPGYQPTLGLTYDAATNGLGTLVGNLPAGTGAVTVVGLSDLSAPFFSGTLVPSPDLLIPFTASGPLTLLPPATINGAFPLGLDLYHQVWAADPAAADGVVASNGTRTTLYRPGEPAGLSWVAHPSNGLEYALGQPATWWHSKSLAEQAGGTLAAIPSAALRDWMVANLFGGALPGTDHWLGLTDAFSEGNWYWLAGDPLTFTDWDPGEPNDAGGFEDYAEWWNGGSGWNDGNGYDVQPAIYQRPVGTTP